MKSFYLTDAGKVRDHNEDSVIIVKNPDNDYLMAIADGMGGHSAGEVASSIAIGYLGKHFNETFKNMSKVDSVNWIRDCVNEINTLIFQYEKNHPESKGMGTTLVMTILTKDYLLFGNIGDSSGFVMKDEKLHKVTYDHTLVNLLVSAGELTKEDGKQMLADEKKKLYELQEKLYADGSKSLLIVLQAMDAAGKDSMIEHVFGGVNPQGCEVTSFKTPTSKEYEHDFLWRHYIALPEKGKIGIFNRSHYESVLVCKVHPEYNLNEKVWDSVSDFDNKFWENRYESIENFEKHLAQNGTTIIKIYLNLSRKEQKKRFLDRINEPDKNWKFSMGDLKERALWDKYMAAYEEAIARTSKKHAPWYVIPADDKWFARVAAIQIIIDTLEKMDLKYPELPEEEMNQLDEAKKQLEME